jgi:hypothetical protein
LGFGNRGSKRNLRRISTRINVGAEAPTPNLIPVALK